MPNIVEVFISIGLLTAIYKYFESKTYDVLLVNSSVNDKEYLVRNLPDKQEASNMLANISINLKKIVDYLVKRDTASLFDKFKKEEFEKENRIDKSSSQEYIETVNLKKAKLIKKLEKDIDRLRLNFNDENLHENTPNAKFTSYSVNKGEKIFFCLRNKSTNKLVELNTIIFVSIHELAHLMTEEVGHPPSFWANFKFLLKVAIDRKTYKYVDFNAYPKDYCGIKITDTPL